jgi:hypothetical protein
MPSGVEGRFSEVQETDNGMKEFGYVDPDGTFHRVGSSQKRSQGGTQKAALCVAEKCQVSR